MSEVIERQHFYHAKATALSGEFFTPLERAIKPQAHTELPEHGGYGSKLEKDYHVEAALSFHSAYSQVAGYKATFPCEGWATLTTAVVEGLNLLDVVTADRVVAQIRTIHPVVGYVPSIILLGTRFENLRIAGHPVKCDFDLNMIGNKPANDAPHTRDSGFVSRVTSQHQRIAAMPNLPVELQERYNQTPLSFEDGETVECSLVNQAEGSYPGETFGHVINIPHFGLLTLGKLKIQHEDFHPETRVPKKTTVSLTMLDANLNCTGDGHIPISTCIANGHGKP